MPITDGKYKNPGWVNNQKPAINAAELNAISTTLENLDAGGSGVGRSMAGETVTLADGATVTVGEGAEIFNNYGLHYKRNIASGFLSTASGITRLRMGTARSQKARRPMRLDGMLLPIPISLL